MGKEFVAADKGKYDAEEDQQQQLPTAEEFLAAGRKPTPKPTPEITLSMSGVPHHTAADIAPGAPGAQLPTAEEFLAAGRAKPEVARKPLPTAEEFLAAGRPAGAAAPEPTDDLSMIAAAHKRKLDLAAEIWQPHGFGPEAPTIGGEIARRMQGPDVGEFYDVRNPYLKGAAGFASGMIDPKSSL